MIEVTGITKRYGNRTVVDDMTFTVAAGKVTGFVGPNGAGKSTTMRMMVGLTRPDDGEVRFAGARYRDLPYPAKAVGAVLDARMHPGRSARNHLRAAAALSSIPTDRVDGVLTEVGLEGVGDQRAGGFSLGMRQRLALAGALLGQPDVLVLDEPANGLDPDGIRWLRSYLRDFADQGGTVFVSSHLIAELALFADDLVVIGAGKLLAAASVAAINAASDTAVIVQTPHHDALLDVLNGQPVDVQTADDRLIIRGMTRTDIAALAFDNHIRLDELTDTRQSLEDSLLDMTHASAQFASA